MIPLRDPMSEATVLKREAHREVEIAYGHLRAAVAFSDWLDISGACDSDQETSRNMRQMITWFEIWLKEESPFC